MPHWKRPSTPCKPACMHWVFTSRRRAGSIRLRAFGRCTFGIEIAPSCSPTAKARRAWLAWPVRWESFLSVLQPIISGRIFTSALMSRIKLLCITHKSGGLMCPKMAPGPKACSILSCRRFTTLKATSMRTIWSSSTRVTRTEAFVPSLIPAKVTVLRLISRSTSLVICM